MENSLLALHRDVGSKIFPPNLLVAAQKLPYNGQIASLGVWDVTVTVEGDQQISEGIWMGISWHLLLGPSWVQDVGFCSDFNWCRCKLCSAAEQHIGLANSDTSPIVSRKKAEYLQIYWNLTFSIYMSVFSRRLYFSAAILKFGVVPLLKI